MKKVYSRSAVLRGIVSTASMIAFSMPAAAQDRTGEYSVMDFSIFGGAQWFNLVKNHPTHSFADGPIFGIRLNQDFSRFVGMEESFTYGINNLRLDVVPPIGVGASPRTLGFGTRNYQIAANPMFHFTPREARVRPFVTLGPALVYYSPTSDAKEMGRALQPTVPGAGSLETKYGPGLLFGLGLKINASRRVGFRLDARGLWTQTPHFNLPGGPPVPGSVYIPNGGTEMPLQATASIVFRFGLRSDTPVPVSLPPVEPKPEPPKPVVDIRIEGLDGVRDVCPGEDVTITVRASGWPQDAQPVYRWKINGQPVNAGGPKLTLNTEKPGTQSVEVEVAAAGASKSFGPAMVRVKDYQPPTVQFSVSPSTINFGDKLPLAATARPSECGGPATLSYTASEGQIVANTFDSSTLGFDTSNRSKLQTKTVTLTATAVDQKGGKGTATADVRVVLKPEARRLDDIVFPTSSSRVNNCGKRLLLEVLTPLIRDDPEGRVILIGHRHALEKTPADLDRQRVLNAAAVLSAGTGICPQLELSRVKADWVGIDQTSATRPAFCGASTELRERSGQIVGASDTRAQFRRVEIWFVPGGAELPPGVNAKDLPEADVKAKGCPK